MQPMPAAKAISSRCSSSGALSGHDGIFTLMMGNVLSCEPPVALVGLHLNTTVFHLVQLPAADVAEAPTGSLQCELVAKLARDPLLLQTRSILSAPVDV